MPSCTTCPVPAVCESARSSIGSRVSTSLYLQSDGLSVPVSGALGGLLQLRPSRDGLIRAITSRCPACFRLMSMSARSLRHVFGRQRFGGVIQALDVVGVFHIRAGEGPTCVHVIRVVCLLAHH